MTQLREWRYLAKPVSWDWPKTRKAEVTVRLPGERMAGGEKGQLNFGRRLGMRRLPEGLQQVYIFIYIREEKR